MTLVLGIDDAGRGPVIGPMILAGVLLTKEQEQILKKSNVKDSKLLAHSQRIKIHEIIKKNSLTHYITKSYPEEIDNFLKSGTNLNTIEAIRSAEIVNALNNPKYQIHVMIDCPSPNILNWKNKVIKLITNPSNLTISCEHRADFNHTHVSAASILAKVAREEEMDKIREKYKKYGEVGSGYSHDAITVEFLKKNGKILADSGIFRKSWSTWKNLFPKDKKQKTLSDY